MVSHCLFSWNIAMLKRTAENSAVLFKISKINSVKKLFFTRVLHSTIRIRKKLEVKDYELKRAAGIIGQ